MFNYEYLSKSSFFQDLTIEGNAKGACGGIIWQSSLTQENIKDLDRVQH